MSKITEIDQFRNVLLSLQARLRGDVQTLSHDALDGAQDSKSPTHMAELGTETYEQDFSLRMMETDQDTLDEITAALNRIDNGTFGLCQKCVDAGKPMSRSKILKERLKAIPFARLCVECARKSERSFAR